MGIDKNSGKGPRLPKTKTNRPSIIKKEHAQRKLKGSFGSPLCCLRFGLFRAPPVGASLLAKAVVQPTSILDVLSPSRAGSLPQGDEAGFIGSQLLDTDLAHPEFLDLARHGHWKLIHELEVARRLEVRDALLAPGLQLLLGGAMAGVELDPGNDLFTITRARYADHLHIGHRRVGEEELFQLARVNVLATTNDHVLVAPGNAHVALFIHAGQVAGVHPAGLVDGFRRTLRVVPVAEH